MPRLARIDRLFRRFVTTGDARALGVVFDATAPELLKIAAYLAGDRQQAEDTVQSAFLVAIERRAEFDLSRPVMPWLCGIVANLARSERRRARSPPGAAVPTAEDPVAAAEMAEFRAAFSRARDGLPEPYRPVLELYLEHGLRAHEIASVLGRPSGTVRAQITRGLDTLRKRLPRGFVAGALVVAAAPGTLSAMRATVMSQARIATAAPALAGAAAIPWAAALVGGGTLNKKLVVAGIIGASLLALGVWIAGDPPSGLGGDPSVPPDHIVLTAGGSDTDDQSAPDAGTVRQVVEPEPAAAGLAASDGQVEVTVRWKDNGTPAARQAIEVVCLGGRLPELRPRRALTDAQGRCRIEGVPPGAVSVFASTGVREEVTVEGGQSTAVTFDLESWGIVRGVVVDAHDRRVPGADVWVSSEIRYRPRNRGYGPGHGQYGGFTLQTDVEGRFETRLSHMQCLAAFKAGYGPSPTMYPCSGKAPAGGIDVVLRLAAEGSELIVEVRDATGAPVADAHVMAGPETPHIVEDTHATTPALRVNTDDRGIAELGPLPTGRLPVQVRAPGFAPWRSKHELPPSGTARLVVHLEVGATVYGVAVDPEGAPVAGAIVYHGPGDKLRSSQCTTDEAGRFELCDLAAGTSEITAWDKGIGQCRTALVLEPGGRHEWNPQLSMRPAITGVVLDLAGRPAAGANVFCHGSGPSPRSASGKTAADGRFSLGPLDQSEVYQVVAEVRNGDRGYVRAIKPGVAPESDVVLQTVPGVERTAQLRGRLLEPDGTPATQVQMTVTPVDGNMGHFVSVESTGEFTSGPCPPGRVRLTVMRRMKTIADLGEHDLAPHETVDLGDVYLPTPGGAVLRITGGDVVKGVANLYREGQFMDSRRIKGDEIAWDALPPGDYRVCVRRGGTTPFAGAAAFAVASGETARAELSVLPAQRRELRFFVDGQCRNYGTLIAEDHTGREVLRDSMEMPGDGKTVRVLLPEGRLRLRFRTGDGWTGETSATVPGEATIDLTLSPP